MELQIYLFPIAEIENIILSYVDNFDDYHRLILVNKYFYDIVANDRMYVEFRNFHLAQKKFYIYANITMTFNYRYRQDNFLKACRNGYLQVAKYLFKKYRNNINIHTDNEYAFRSACENGHIELVKWLLSLQNIHGKINIHIDDEYAFRLACENGHIELVKFLYSVDNTINVCACEEYAFRYSCIKGHLEVAKWIYSLANPGYGYYRYFWQQPPLDTKRFKNKVEIHACDDYAFYWSCRLGYLEVAKWIYSLDHGINIYENSHKALRWSCQYGQIEVVKWIYSLYQKTDIRIKNIGFYESCTNGHLEIAKWFYSLDGIDTDTNKIAIQSLKNGHLVVGRWLNSLIK